MSVSSSSRCLVTGASDPASVGYACAQALLQAGAGKVTIMGRDEDNVSAAVTSLTNGGIDNPQAVSGVVGDLKKPETMASVIEEVVGKMGGLDVLVISGGNGGSEYLGLDALDPASYRMMHDVSVLSPLFLTEAAVPELVKSTASSNGATVVMVSSMAPRVPWPDTAPFSYAKAAQNAMIETLAFKYRTKNIRVNGVLPACIHTGHLDIMAMKKNVSVEEYAKLRADAHPMEKVGTPQDVANAVVFLASPASGFTTGELLKVDGGLHLSNWFNRPRMLAEYVGGSKTS
jgi:NAD(P)-dependent dehydrogenase (short-subunit alcohol dehydrogenase family)